MCGIDIFVIKIEYNIEAPEEITEEMSDLLVKCMEEAGKRFCKVVPLLADASIGNHWIH